MNFNFSDPLFQLGGEEITLRMLLIALGGGIALILIYHLLVSRLIRRLVNHLEEESKDQRRLFRALRNAFFLLMGIIALLISQIDQVLYANEQITIKAATILEALFILQFAWLLDWALSRFIIRNYYRNREREKEDRAGVPKVMQKDPENIASRLIQYIVYVVAILLILSSFQIDYTIYTISGKEQDYDFKLSNIFAAILVLLIARLAIWVLIQLVLYGYYRSRKVNIGSQYAINQLLTYVIYVVAALVALDSLGIKMTVIWGGAAALLVGVGLGLQQTFNDLISGVIILFERTVEVGDVVKVDGLLGKVIRIGLRTSVLETWENIAVLVPNSKLISENVINFSHNDIKTRYLITVGVAYGSDTELVKKLLLEAASNVRNVLKFPAPFVRFVDFGNSSLDFELHFWTLQLITVEDIKSDLRFEIDRLFRENGVTIPFPQRDLWLRNAVSLDQERDGDQEK